MKNQNAIVLLSGGLDSATTLYWALFSKKWRVHALVFDYGQRHGRERRSARALARGVDVPIQEIKIRLPWGGSSLLNPREKLPHHRAQNIGRGPIPSTYVPARNTLFLSYALSWADTVGAQHIVIGANALDYSGYPDCRPRFLKAMEQVGAWGTRLGAEKKRPPRIWAPLLRLSKSGIIRLGLRLSVPYEKTWSCYQGGSQPCGRCDLCQLRALGFADVSMKDPALEKR